MGSVAILFLIAVESLGRPSRVEASGLSPVAVASCTATWTDVGLEAIPNAWWSLATGAPDPSTFSLNPGCIYDTADPANTPLILPPAEEPPWMAIVNGLPVPVCNLDPAAGRTSPINLSIEANTPKMPINPATASVSVSQVNTRRPFLRVTLLMACLVFVGRGMMLIARPSRLLR